MDNYYLQLAISLSMVSFLGSKYDTRRIVKEIPVINRILFGIRKNDINFILPISLNDLKQYNCQDTAIFILNKIYDVRNRESLLLCLENLFNGSEISRQIHYERQKLLFMNYKEKQAYLKPRMKDNFSRKYYNTIMYFDHKWSVNSLLTIDYANAISLVRIGFGMSWLSEDEANEQLLRFFKVIIKQFSSFLEFGKLVEIGHKLQREFICYKHKGTSSIRNERSLSKAYYAIWSQMSWPNNIETEDVIS